MSAYWAIVSARFRALLQYRAAAVAGLTTQVFWGLIRVMIFAAFYKSVTSQQPMTYEQVVVYIWLGQAVIRLQPWDVDTEVWSMIQLGAVVYELLKPMDLYALWFSRAVAQRTAPTILRAVPMFVIAGLFFGLKPPPSLASGLAFAVAIVGMLLLSCSITVLATMSMLWTVSGEGIRRLLPSAVILFSGMIIPLPLFPEWAQSALNLLPFRGLGDAPFRLYMGHIPPGGVVWVVAHQLVWTAAFVIAGRLLLARGVRRLVAQGG